MTRPRKAPPPPLPIVIDTREQLPYDFACITSPVLPFTTTERGLLTGDYSIDERTDEITIDRKSLPDMLRCLGGDRERFEDVLRRMSNMDSAHVVIEAELSELLNPAHAYAQGPHPKSIMASLIAWNRRYGVTFWPCPGRHFAEQLTYRILERFERDARLEREGVSPHAVPIQTD